MSVRRPPNCLPHGFIPKGRLQRDHRPGYKGHTTQRELIKPASTPGRRCGPPVACPSISDPQDRPGFRLAGRRSRKSAESRTSLIEFLHDRFETENRIDRVADDGRVALRVDTDVAASDRAIMQRDADTKRLAVGPFDCAREPEEIPRNLKCCGAIDFFISALRSNKRAWRRR